MKTKYLSGLVLLLLLAVGFASCNDDEEHWYDSMKDGRPFFSGHVVRFYFIDEEGHDLINMIALPISSKTLLDTPPAPPTEFATTTDGLWYNNEINNIVMDIFGNCKRWGSIIFLFRERAGDIRRPVGTAGISVYL